MPAPLRSRYVPCALLAAALLAAPIVSAQEGAGARAELLFNDGRRLVAEGKFDEGCRAFAESQKLDPSISTALNLGDCYEKAQRYYSAWATYTEALQLARSKQRSDHEATANERLKGVAGRFSYLTVKTATPVAGMVIKRNGFELLPSELGQKRPVDGGKHEITVTAPKKKSFSVVVTVPVQKDSVAAEAEVLIPTLEDAPDGTPGTPQVIVIAQPPQPAVPYWGGQRIAGLATGGTGVLLGGIGLFLNLRAKSYQSDADGQKSTTGPNKGSCPVSNSGDDCRALEDKARANSIGAIAMYAVGGAALVTGVIVFFTSPSAAKPSDQKGKIWMSPTLGGLAFGGAW